MKVQLDSSRIRRGRCIMQRLYKRLITLDLTLFSLNFAAIAANQFKPDHILMQRIVQSVVITTVRDH